MCLGVFKAEIFLFPFLKFLSLPLNSDSCIEALNQLEAADDILVKIFDFVKNPLVFIADFWNWGTAGVSKEMRWGVFGVDFGRFEEI